MIDAERIVREGYDLASYASSRCRWSARGRRCRRECPSSAISALDFPRGGLDAVVAMYPIEHEEFVPEGKSGHQLFLARSIEGLVP